MASPTMGSTSPVISKRRRRRKGGVLRALRWLAFMPVASRVPTYSRLIWALASDPRVPANRKVILAGAAGYVLFGRDLIPEKLLILGGIDDVAVLVLAVEIFFDGIPDEVLEEKLDELQIDSEAFRRDMDQVRRLTPAPVRRIIRELPGALDAAGRLIKQSSIGPRARAWITDVRPGRAS